MNPVNPNTASRSSLIAVPGIGPALADRIIAARPFASLEDMQRVSGIGPALLERLRPFLMMEEAAETATRDVTESSPGKIKEVEMYMYQPPPLINRYQIAGLLLGIVGVIFVIGWILNRLGSEEE